jgi:hypothetical protein
MADPTTSEQRLAAIRERHAAATEGPWWFDESDTCWRLHGVMGRIPPLRRDGFFPEHVMNKQILKAAKQGTPYAEYWPDKADAAFIVGAWKDVRDLLAEVDRLSARVAELTSLLNDPDRLAAHALELRAIYAEADADAERDRLADGGEL